jgi:hypothetical protein
MSFETLVSALPNSSARGKRRIGWRIHGFNVFEERGMANKLTDVVKVRMLHCLPLPRTIWATDNPDEVQVDKFITEYDPEVELVQEVFAKIIESQKKGDGPSAPIKLMIKNNRFIVKDPDFQLLGVAAHLEVIRSAADSVHSALDRIETALPAADTALKGSSTKSAKPPSTSKKATSKSKKRKPKKKR